ncbi:HIT family protein [Actinomadura rubrisoli]|uniref:HIT domain-containing protein n=1 Tax=Actinomadura rubrisoli TaxID=2530368 RepID=A0A4R5AIV3_9ACTN|nr:hypothetical protein [Actinomadura rubrisoli]TDD71440.1 hypothetical protein E1298_35800 [Actinomadura rubrisoli]
MADLPGEAAVLARDGDFLLMPDVAPLAEGHLLLVTREHHQCAGEFGEGMWTRARLWRDRVARLYREAYGSDELLLFEHGPGSSQGGGACIDHAHWHFLPGTLGLRGVVEERGRPGAPADHAALRACFRTGRSYLLIEEAGSATVHPGDGVRSQFLRWAVMAAGRNGTGHGENGHGENGHSGSGAGRGGIWRWQEMFGLPESRSRFLRTVQAVRRAMATVPGDGQRADSHQ